MMLSYNAIPIIAFGSNSKEETHRWSVVTTDLLDAPLIIVREFTRGKQRVRELYLRKRIVPIAPLFNQSYDTQEFIKTIDKRR